MKSTITSSTDFKSTNKTQFWRDPNTNVIYETYGVAKDSVSPLEQAWPVYNLSTHFEAQKLAQNNEENDGLYHAFLDTRLESLALQYEADVKAGGEQRFAALRSEQNAAVNIINVWSELQGRRDRKYAAKAMAREIPTKNLVISIDKVAKFSGLTKLDEGQLTQLKTLSYSRQNFTASKYGLKFVIDEESRLKNVHNVVQDAIQIASNRVEQRASEDVISALTGASAQAAINPWDTFVSNTALSTGDPLTDIGIAQTTIEGTYVGGKFSKIGMHQLTLAQYLKNTNVRGIASTNPHKYDFEPGVGTLPGLDGIGLVKDNSFQQGIVYCVDSETEDAAVHFYQGPQRMGSAHDEETGDDKYFIIDYHLAVLAQSETAVQITGTTTPLFW